MIEMNWISINLNAFQYMCVRVKITLSSILIVLNVDGVYAYIYIALKCIYQYMSRDVYSIIVAYMRLLCKILLHMHTECF